MTAHRDRDAIVRAWLDAGPRDLPDPVRYSITATARTLPQRGPRRFPLRAALAGLTVIATIVLIATLTALPRLVPTPQVGSESTALTSLDSHITVSYRVPDGTTLAIDDSYANATGLEDGIMRAVVGFTEGATGIYGFGVGRMSEEREPGEGQPGDVQPGAHGVVVADVSDTKLHGMLGQPLGSDPATFFEVLEESKWWTVVDVSATEIDGRPAMAGTPAMTETWFTHLDTTDGQGTHVDLAHPSHLIVTTVGDTLLLVQIWAGTEAELQAWLPKAMEFVDSIALTTTDR